MTIKKMGVVCPDISEESEQDISKLDSNTLDWVISTLLEFEDLAEKDKHNLIDIRDNLPVGLLFDESLQKKKELDREIWRQYDNANAFFVLFQYIIEIQKKIGQK